MRKPRKPTHGSVPLKPPFTGTVRLQPRLLLNAHLWPAPSTAATATIPLADVPAAVIVPVNRNAANCRLPQATTDGWNRRLRPLPRPPTPPPFFCPVLISARNAWHLRDHQLQIFDRGYVLDGACRLEAACHFQTPAFIPLIVLFGLTPTDELQLRSYITATTPETAPSSPNSDLADSEHDGTPHRIGTNTPRLEVSHQWITLTFESEPFVVPTSLGYAPAVLARRYGANQRQHLLLGAKSLARPLEMLRRKVDGLTGQVVQLRKAGPERTAAYELRTSSE